jgi:hypothetical protein
MGSDLDIRQYPDIADRQTGGCCPLTAGGSKRRKIFPARRRLRHGHLLQGRFGGGAGGRRSRMAGSRTVCVFERPRRSRAPHRTGKPPDGLHGHHAASIAARPLHNDTAGNVRSLAGSIAGYAPEREVERMPCGPGFDSRRRRPDKLTVICSGKLAVRTGEALKFLYSKEGASLWNSFSSSLSSFPSSLREEISFQNASISGTPNRILNGMS